MSSLCRINEEFKFVRLQNLRIIATLGVGGFGRVELVQIAGDHQRSFALKQMKKAQVKTFATFNCRGPILINCNLFIIRDNEDFNTKSTNTFPQICI